MEYINIFFLSFSVRLATGFVSHQFFYNFFDRYFSLSLLIIGRVSYRLYFFRYLPSIFFLFILLYY